jgi:hypothetical protein
MKIVIPIGPKDATNLNLLVQTIVLLGEVKHPILIVTVPSMLTQATDAQEKLLTVCQSVDLVDTGDEFADGWFMGPNRMFHWVGMHLHAQQNNQSWLWLEPDCCLMRPGWADALEKEYREAKMPYMGFVRPQKHKDEKGIIYFKAGDNMMLGVAVYSPQMLNDQEMIPLFNNLGISARPAHPKYPWDIYLRWRFFKRGVHDTPLIHDKWRTLNYRREDGKIVCDPDPEAPMGVATGGALPDAAVLVHGCKDGTLQRLVIEENSKPVAKAVTQGEPIIFTDRFRAVRGAPKGVSEDLEKSVRDAIQDIRSEGVKPRVGDIAKRAGLSAADTKPILDQLGHVIGTAGWVTLKEEI